LKWKIEVENLKIMCKYCQNNEENNHELAWIMKRRWKTKSSLSFSIDNIVGNKIIISPKIAIIK
jgi:hypothetical protein